MSSIEPPTQPASAASRIAFDAALGSCAPQFSRSALTGRSVASAMARQFSRISARLTLALPSELATPRLVVASASNPTAASSRAVPASQGFRNDEGARPLVQGAEGLGFFQLRAH